MITQNFQDRGKVAFVQDQAKAAAEAFCSNDMKGTEQILESIRDFLDTWLQELNGGKPQ